MYYELEHSGIVGEFVMGPPLCSSYQKKTALLCSIEFKELSDVTLTFLCLRMFSLDEKSGFIENSIFMHNKLVYDVTLIILEYRECHIFFR